MINFIIRFGGLATVALWVTTHFIQRSRDSPIQQWVAFPTSNSPSEPEPLAWPFPYHAFPLI